MQVVNNTPFPAIAWISSDHQEKRYITTLARVKYRFESMDEEGLWTLNLDPDQGELFVKDIFYDEKKRDVQFESDFVPYKQRADLIVNLSDSKQEYGKCGVEVLRYDSQESSSSLLRHMSLDNLGFVHRADKERMQWTGTADQKWIDNKAPALPDDFSEKHYNAADPKMQLSHKYFEAGDVIVLHKLLSGQHKQMVMIPGVYLKATPKLSLQKAPVLLEADTVIFDIEQLDSKQNALYISYRQRVEIESKAQSVSVDMLLDEAFIEKKGV